MQHAEQAVAVARKEVAAAQHDAACMHAEAADAQRRLVAMKQAFAEQGGVHERVREACLVVL